MLTRSGLTPVHQKSGPDFRCALGSQLFVVEAKMARTVEAVERELLKAGRQIRGAGLPGIIMLDYTFAVNSRESNHVFASPTPLTGVSVAQRKRFRAFRERYLRKLEPKLVASGVVGLVFVDSLVMQDGVDPDGRTGRWCLVTFRDQLALPCKLVRDKGLVETVFEALKHLGLPTPAESY
jgi:hypothetical protein